MINIKGLNKADVLVALYNNSKPLGLGFLNPACKNPLLVGEAMEYLKQTTYFDYLQGRVLKVDLSKDEFDPRLYDRDNGEGSALGALKEYFKDMKIDID